MLSTGAVAEVVCGYGPVHAGDSVGFSHAVSFTIPTGPGTGYLIDCQLGADAYMEFQGTQGSSYMYAVWGQLGDYN